MAASSPASSKSTWKESLGGGGGGEGGREGGKRIGIVHLCAPSHVSTTTLPPLPPPPPATTPPPGQLQCGGVVKRSQRLVDAVRQSLESSAARPHSLTSTLTLHRAPHVSQLGLLGGEEETCGIEGGR